MQPISDNVLSLFNAVLDKKVHSSGLHADYRKWLRFFLDYCSRYDPPKNRSELVRLFIAKIRSKGASGSDLHHAAHAVSLFFSMGAKEGTGSACSGAEASRKDAAAELAAYNSGPRYLHPLRAEQDDQGAEKPAGFLRKEQDR